VQESKVKNDWIFFLLILSGKLLAKLEPAICWFLQTMVNMKYPNLLDFLQLKYLGLTNRVEQDYGIEAAAKGNRDTFA
jgi:hypothetical protein